jgi:uridine phosphorylase
VSASTVAPSFVTDHTRLSRGDVGRYVLLPGDPGRCEPIASRFTDARLVASHREYTTWSGTLDGELVTVTSTGIGCPSTAIAAEELVQVGAGTLIRVGTSGGMQPGTRQGDLAVVTAAIRDEGTTMHYVPEGFPALADVDVVVAVRDSARALGHRHRLGVTQSKDSFYGEVEPDRMPLARQLHQRWDAWVAGGAICSEMECAALFVVAAIHRVRAGGLMIMSGGPDVEPSDTPFTLDPLLDTAVESVRLLIARDRARAGDARG